MSTTPTSQQQKQENSTNTEKPMTHKKPSLNEVGKMLDDLDDMWWDTKPHMGYCGNCQKYDMLRPQDAGMFCYNC